MGFAIDHGGLGWFGGLLLALLIGVGLIVLYTFVTAAKQAHDEVVEDEGDDPDLIA